MPKIYLLLSDAYRRGRVWRNVVPFPIARTLPGAERAYHTEKARIARLECQGKYVPFNDRIQHWYCEALGIHFPPEFWFTEGRK